MHGRNGSRPHSRHVAGDSTSAGRPTADGLPQRADSSRPMVASSPLHGPRLENPAQSPTSPRPASNDTETDMESLCAHGGGNCCQDRVTSDTERLASVGNEPNERRKSLHSQVQATMVEDTPLQGPVSVGNVLRLLERQAYRCALTGRRLTPETSSIDHIVPIRCGGEHTIENAQVLHKDVNRAKGSLTSDEFIGMCREVARWADTPSTDEEVH